MLAFVAGYFVLRHFRDPMYAFGVVLFFAYPTFFLYVILTSCASATGEFGIADIGPSKGASQQGGGLTGGPGSVTTPTLPTYLVFFLLLLALGVVGVLVLTSDHDKTDEREEAAADEDEEDPAPDVRAVGRAAGRAADRIETDGEFENEVYRAWAEMTTHLDVERPDSSTPGEFALAAAEAGMDRGDVDRLTDLFSEVRYGGAEPTGERESEAVEVLRRIEATYAGDGS